MARGKKTGGRDFKPGDNGGSHRPKGAQDHLTRLAELVGTDRKSLVEWYRHVSQEPRYRESLLSRIAVGEASAMERLLAEQVYGKPVDIHRFEGDKALFALVLLSERHDPLAPAKALPETPSP